MTSKSRNRSRTGPAVGHATNGQERAGGTPYDSSGGPALMVPQSQVPHSGPDSKAEINQSKEGLDPQTLALVRIADALDCLVQAVNEVGATMETMELSLDWISRDIRCWRTSEFGEPK